MLKGKTLIRRNDFVHTFIACLQGCLIRLLSETDDMIKIENRSIKTIKKQRVYELKLLNILYDIKSVEVRDPIKSSTLKE